MKEIAKTPRGPRHYSTDQNGNGSHASLKPVHIVNGRPKRYKAVCTTEQILEVAQRFYIQEQSRAEIAEALEIDPRTVAVWLRKARDTGIVTIAFHNPADGPVPKRPADREPVQMFLPIKPVF